MANKCSQDRPANPIRARHATRHLPKPFTRAACGIIKTTVNTAFGKNGVVNIAVIYMYKLMIGIILKCMVSKKLIIINQV